MKKIVTPLLILLSMAVVLRAGVHRTAEKHVDAPVKISHRSGTPTKADAEKKARFLERRAAWEAKLNKALQVLPRNRSTTMDADLTIKKLSLVEDSYGDLRIYCMVENKGTGGPVYTRVYFTVYDASGNTLGTTWSNVALGRVVLCDNGWFAYALEKGYTGFFTGLTSIEWQKAHSVSYTFEYYDYSYTYRPTRLKLDSQKAREGQDYFGGVEYTGKVSNPSSTHIAYECRVHFAVLTPSKDAILDMGYQFLEATPYENDESSALYPGESGTYLVGFHNLDSTHLGNPYEYGFEFADVEESSVGTYSVTVNSEPSGAPITVSPTDNYGDSGGDAPYTFTYDRGDTVTITAAASHSGEAFDKWDVGGTEYTSRSITLTMDRTKDATAYYGSYGATAWISTNRWALNFGAGVGGPAPGPQSFMISNTGEGKMDWTVTTDSSRVTCTPTSGSGSGIVTVHVDTTGLGAGYDRYTVYISSEDAGNSSQELWTYVDVMTNARNETSIGEFATPADGARVSGSVAVTGWAVDVAGISDVIIYLDNNGTLAPIGGAVFVEGARDDITDAYYWYPGSYKAGWGYMLLTNFLPGGGNGTYTLRAVAVDSAGKQTGLGAKTIHVDNANAVEPFGAIDTPAQGGLASGKNYSNMGWVLTPKPKTVPKNGSTIDVYIDNQFVGHPVYNQPRGDIEGFFPGYSNSGGSMATLPVNLDEYHVGVHQIYWIVTDDDNKAAGIGSRFFTVSSTGNGRKKRTASGDRSNAGRPYNPNFGRKVTVNGDKTIDMRQMERLQLTFEGGIDKGYRSHNGELRPLPAGSGLTGDTFTWFPAPGFSGTYRLVFYKGKKAVNLTINIK